jgi:hypothetical protein
MMQQWADYLDKLKAGTEVIPLHGHMAVALVEERNKDGSVKRDEFDRTKKKQRGDSLLYKEFGIRKQLLHDLYIRFIRLAEERIGEAAKYGVVSYISNSSYLTGRSHPLMRRSLLTNSHAVWIDNLNGDKYRIGKIIPRSLSGADTRDDSAFTTEMDPRGFSRVPRLLLGSSAPEQRQSLPTPRWFTAFFGEPPLTSASACCGAYLRV